jgi:hypothetical protein
VGVWDKTVRFKTDAAMPPEPSVPGPAAEGKAV